jgi:hypothetical protein
MSLDKKSIINFVTNESTETTLHRFKDDGDIEYYYPRSSVKKGYIDRL